MSSRVPLPLSHTLLSVAGVAWSMKKTAPLNLPMLGCTAMAVGSRTGSTTVVSAAGSLRGAACRRIWLLSAQYSVCEAGSRASPVTAGTSDRSAVTSPHLSSVSPDPSRKQVSIRLAPTSLQ